MEAKDKSPVSIVQELCAKNRIQFPKYEFASMPTLAQGFNCKLSVLSIVATGQGRSKRAAKHQAAVLAVRLMCAQYPHLKGIQSFTLREEVSLENVPQALVDYCAQRRLPLPIFKIENEDGNSASTV